MLELLFTALLPFLLVFSLLVLVHECGHFFAAKFFNMKVEEFGLGIPPRVYAKQKGETVFSINAIPLGGFVKLLGEDGNDQQDPRSFSAQPYLPRAIVLLAGVLMNVIAAWVIFTVLVFSQGIDTHSVTLHIYDVQPTSPAALAGIEKNDAIISIGNKEYPTFEEFTTIAKESVGKSIPVTVRRGDQTTTVAITPREPSAEQGSLGVMVELSLSAAGQMGDMLAVKEAVPAGNFLASITYGFALNYAVVINTFQSLGALGMHLLQITLPKDIAGPIGILQLVGVHTRLGLFNLLFLVGVLSINLAVLNVLPIPALDGGRFTVITVEKILHKKLPPNVEALIHTSGFVLLLALVVAVSFQDIARMF